MASVDLGTLTFAGNSQVTLSGTLAAHFITASGSASASVTATLVKTSKLLQVSSGGQSTVSITAKRARNLSIAADARTTVATDMLRKRGILANADGKSQLSFAGTAWRGVAAVVNAAASVLPSLGVKRALPAATISSGMSTDLVINKGGIVAQDIYVQVTGAPVYNNDADPIKGTPGTWTLPVTLKRGGTLGTRIPTGSAVVKWGEYSSTPTTGYTGGIILTSDLASAPYIDVFTVYKNLSGTTFPWDDAALKPRVRMGNLKGVLGNVADEWGIAMSTDLSDNTKPYIKASNNGLSIKDADLNVTNGSVYFGDAGQTKYMKWDKTSLTVKGIINADSGNLGNLNITGSLVTGVSPSPRIEITPSMIAGYSDATTKQFYLQSSNGKAYAGNGAVKLDSTGVSFDGSASNDPNSITWYADSTFASKFLQLRPKVLVPSGAEALELVAGASTSVLVASSLRTEFKGRVWSDEEHYISGGLSVGSLAPMGGGLVGAGNIVYTGSLMPGGYGAYAYYPYANYVTVLNGIALAANGNWGYSYLAMGAPVAAKAYVVRLAGSWATVVNTNTLFVRPSTAVSYMDIVLRSQAVNVSSDMFGIVRADAYGNVALGTGAGAVNSVYFIVYGCFF